MIIDLEHQLGNAVALDYENPQRTQALYAGIIGELKTLREIDRYFINE